MGFTAWYEEAVLPRFIKCACSAPEILALRQKVVPRASGSVFEIGCGGGINQQFYDAGKVTAYAGIDPSPKLLDYAREAAQAKGWEADIRQGVGEAIPFGNDAFDTVVCTYTLCSVADQAQVLKELHRILKPGGRLLFLEHGLSPDPGPARWQRRIEPVWKRMMGNCHLTRPIGAAVARADLAVTPLGQQYNPKMPRWAGWMEWGEAVKSS